MPNLRLVQKTKLSSFRRMAIGTWRTTYDPTVYGAIALRADKMLAYLEELRARTGRRVTLTHLVAKAAAIMLSEMPDANAVLRWNRIYLRQDIGVFFQVVLEDEKTGEIDLSGTTVFDAHLKSVVDIVDEFNAKVASVRRHDDSNLERSRGMFQRIPAMLLNAMLDFLSITTGALNLDLSAFGIPRDPFGSIMITNIGSLGLEEAYVPLVPYSHVPLLIALGAVREEAVVENGQLVVGKVVRAFATFDHRVLDGAHAARMAKTLRRIFDDPEGELGPLPPAQLGAGLTPA